MRDAHQDKLRHEVRREVGAGGKEVSSTTVVSAGKGCIALGYAVCGVAGTACVMCRTDSLSVWVVVTAGRHAVNAANKGTGGARP